MSNFRIFFEECGMDGIAEVKAKTVFHAIDLLLTEYPSANILDAGLKFRDKWIVCYI